MTKKLSLALALLLTMGIMTSCFEVREKLHLKKNGSGQFVYTLDFSESSNTLSIAKMMAGFRNKTSPDEKIKKSMQQTLEALQSTEGISNANIERNDERFIYKVSFDFDDVESLNAALNKFVKSEEEITFFSYDGRTFSRSDAVSIRETIEREMANEGSSLNGLDPYDLFSEATYVTEYSFDKAIKEAAVKGKVTQEDHRLKSEHFIFSKDEKESMAQSIRLR